MKKFLFYLFLFIAILSSVFAYILYTEGAFETKLESEHYKPFEMKCEAGKCGAGKCGGEKTK